MNIYAISGLGADKRVYSYLSLNQELIHLEWIKNYKNELLKDYSLRLAEKIDTSKEFIIIGLSFGGLVAVEISKFLKPKHTILISSVETKCEIPLFYKLTGKSKIFNLIPTYFLAKSNSFLTFMFGTKKKELLKNIIEDADTFFSKWAVIQLMNWNNEEKLKNCTKIGGSNDRILPQKNIDFMIQYAGHFMIVDNAEELSRILNDLFKKVSF